MILIFLYSFLTIFILFFLGFGITVFFLPKQLKPYAFWLSPWIGIVFLVFTLVILSLAGFLISQLVIPICIGLSICNIVAVIKKRKYFPLNFKEDIIIWLFVIGSFIFNLSPLILQHKSLTSISLGNNDIIMYANVPDYLVTHSIQESFDTNVSLAINHVLRETYRWGPVVLSSFFLTIFHLEGYQYAYIFQTVIFALTLPLIYLFLKILFKPSVSGLILSLTLTAFNVNLLYILYHGFSAQVLYWGILLCLYILVFKYFEILPIKSNMKIFNMYDVIIGVTLAVLNFSFHEGLIFVVLPLIIFLGIHFLLRKKVRSIFISSVKIILVFILFGSISLLNSINVDFVQAFGKISKEPLGWQPFRNSIQYPNPVEIMGLYSIHSFEALPVILAVIISLIIIGIILYGLRNSKSQLLLGSFLFVFLLFYIWTSLIRHHFFFYYRAITLTLPLLIILFTIGIIHFFRRWRILSLFTLILFLFLELFSAVKLNKRLLKEHLFVNESFATLEEIPFQSTNNDPIYTEFRLNNLISSYWKSNWTEYFLYKDKPPAIPPQATNQFENSIPDNSLILISKNQGNQLSTPVLLSSVVWQNPYYLLGKLCNSPECLLNRPEDLTGVTPGKDIFEDSLLITGWSTKESNNRWAVGKESTLR